MRKDRFHKSASNEPINLPITKHKEEIIDLVGQSSVVIISGLTGSGKSTQAPQYVLDANPSKTIAVCQPRRLAAVSLAERVCSERKCKIGTEVGYHIGMENCESKHTKLTYMTYGIMTQQLLHNSAPSYDYIFMDEVHERSLEMDFLFVVLKKIINQQKRQRVPFDKQLRLIVMSATLNNEQFQEYFSSVKMTSMISEPTSMISSQKGSLSLRKSTCIQDADKKPAFNSNLYEKAPIVIIDSGCKWHVEEIYLEDTLKMLDPLRSRFGALASDRYKSYPSLQKAQIKPDLFECGCELILKLSEQFMRERRQGDILVFLPGIMEIQRMKKLLISFSNDNYDYDRVRNRQNIEIRDRIVEVHSVFSEGLHDKLFVSKVKNKILLSTNIGESSITLPNCTVVIDYCLSKRNEIDKYSGINKFQTLVASKSNLIQRKGRVGRVADGENYRMITKSEYKKLRDFQRPEIQCVNLEQSILKTKQLEQNSEAKLFNHVYDVFLNVLDPPLLEDVDSAIKNLLDEGALSESEESESQKWKSQSQKENLKITDVGRFMASMPCDIKLSKLIMLGIKFGITEKVINIAAILSSTNSFFIHERYIPSKEIFLRNFIFYNQNQDNDYLLRERIFKDWKDSFFEKKKSKLNQTLNLSNISEGGNNQVSFIEESEQEKASRLREEQRSVVQFTRDRKSNQERWFCEDRGVSINNMRQILRISQSIKEGLAKFGIHYESTYQKEHENSLFVFSLMYGFPHSPCTVTFKPTVLTTEWSTVKEEDDYQIRLYFKGKEKYYKEILRYINLESQFRLGRRHPQWVEVIGTSNAVKKILLIGQGQSGKKRDKETDLKQRRIADQKMRYYCQIFKDCLQRPRVKKSHNFTAKYEKKKVIVFEESINRDPLCEANFNWSESQKYLVSHKFTQSKENVCYLLSTCVQMTKEAQILGMLLGRKDVKIFIHPSKQFVEQMEIDKVRYRVPFFLGQSQIELVLKTRKIGNMKEFHSLEQLKDWILSESEKQSLLSIINTANALPEQQKWEKIFVGLNYPNFKPQNNVFELDSLSPAQFEVVARDTEQAFYMQYKNWKLSVYKFMNFQLFQIQNKEVLLCKKCYGQGIFQKIAEVEDFLPQQQSIHLKNTSENWICPQTEEWYKQQGLTICCKNRHAIAVTKNAKLGLLDKGQTVLYLPYRKIVGSEHIKNEEELEEMIINNEPKMRKDLRNIEVKENHENPCGLCSEKSPESRKQAKQNKSTGNKYQTYLKPVSEKPKQKQKPKSNQQLWSQKVKHLNSERHQQQFRHFTQSLEVDQNWDML